MMESGAILIYLADKTGKFLADDGARQYDALQWLMFQMGGVGPMFGQAHHFLRAAKEQVPYAIERYGKEAKRLYGVLNEQLEANEYLAGRLLDRRHRHLSLGRAPRVAQGRPRTSSPT